MEISRRSVLAAATAALATPACAGEAIAWRTLAPGVEHGQAELDARVGDRQLHILRLDPAHVRFTLLTAAGLDVAPRPAHAWAQEHHLIAAINAGMFRANNLPVGYAKADGRVVQPHLSADRSVFAFDDARARLIDTACEPFDADAETNALQGIRMISCGGDNVWAQQPRLWSIAAIAQDTNGRILFLHARSPLSVHDFIAALQGAPLDVARAMYQEGGPEATLYVKAGGVEIERVGSYETGFNENDDNRAAWALPNVFGVLPR